MKARLISLHIHATLKVGAKKESNYLQDYNNNNKVDCEERFLCECI